jgi:hypothetical protein
MFFLQRFMKTPEAGSMSEGWLIQEGIVFISQYLHQADSSMPTPFCIRHLLSEMDVREEDGPTVVLQGMDHSVNLGRDLHAKINNFFILNTQVMRPLVDRYNAVRISIKRERAHIWV